LYFDKNNNLELIYTIYAHQNVDKFSPVSNLVSKCFKYIEVDNIASTKGKDMKFSSKSSSLPTDTELDLDGNNEQFCDEDVIIQSGETQQEYQSTTEDNKASSESLNYSLDQKLQSKYEEEKNQQNQSQTKAIRQDSILSSQSFEAPLSQILEEPSCKEDQSMSLSTITGISNSKKKHRFKKYVCQMLFFWEILLQRLVEWTKDLKLNLLELD
jgi:hypothetical protein